MEHAILRPPTRLGAILCALLVSGCGLLSSEVAAEDETVAEAGIISDVKATADRLLTAARDQLGIPAASPKPAATDAPRPERPAPPRATRTTAPPAVPAEPQVDQPLPMTPREMPLAFAPVPSLPPAADTPILPDRTSATRMPADLARATALYSSTDARVEPPAWRTAMVSSPQLTGSGRHLPALELIVGTDGSVERARLLPGSRQLPDMMILSSAKMWQFEPARLDGEPVRYRLVVRLNEREDFE